MSTPLTLVVDDEADLLDLIRITLGRMGVSVVTATTLAEAKRQLERHRPDLCLADLNLPDGSGIELLHHIAHHQPELPVAVITAYGNVESAVAAMKAGAFDFLAKPVDLADLRTLVESALRLRLRAFPTKEHRPPDLCLVGGSPAMQQIRVLIAKLALTQAPVFITGESGTGKELAARLIHAQGPRCDRAFVPVNCGAIPPDLVESELFGHKKGSFTGATSDQVGLFQAAHGGTLFLDEVADLPLSAQVKLLRAVQERRVRPVGATHEVPVDVRIISASHRDLLQEVEQGRFRHDLFYRLHVITLRLPALREHPEDIPDLAAHILARLAEREGRAPRCLSPEALAALQRYPFPGNVRELENLLERACALGEGQCIEVGDLYLPHTGCLETLPAQATSARVPDPSLARALGMSPLALAYDWARLGLQQA
ncbi:MAG: sigma-54-dependent transcriptional regulator [Thermochromatium sp.]